MGMESSGSGNEVPPVEELQTETPAQTNIEGPVDPKIEKIKELNETVNFWIEYAKEEIKYFNEVYDLKTMEDNVARLGRMAGSPEEKGTLAEKANWIRNRLVLYSSMIPAFEDIKKNLAEGNLEYPWGGSIERDIRSWEAKRNNQ